MESRLKIDREFLFRIFFLSAFGFLLYQLFLLAKPFLSALLISIMLTITFYPAYRILKRKTANAHIAAFLMTCLVALAAVLPLIGFIWLVLRESDYLFPVFQNTMNTLQNGDFTALKEKLPVAVYDQGLAVYNFFSGLNIELKPWLTNTARETALFLTGITTTIAHNFFFILIKLAILFFSLFFFFRDGDRFFQWFIGIVPMKTEDKLAVAHSAYETFRAVSAGVFITAAAQGLLATLGYWAAGLQLPLILGLATGVVALLGASFLVTVPAALFVMSENFGKGMALFIWGAIVVGWIDNLIKPYFIGVRTRMPFALVFFSILGGLKMYGLLGIVLGPMLVACVLTFIRIYKETYN